MKKRSYVSLVVVLLLCLVGWAGHAKAQRLEVCETPQNGAKDRGLEAEFKSRALKKGLPVSQYV